MSNPTKMASLTTDAIGRPIFLENIMEMFELLLTSKYGFAALASVTLAITMLVSTLGTLAYKVRQSGGQSS